MSNVNDLLIGVAANSVFAAGMYLTNRMVPSRILSDDVKDKVTDAISSHLLLDRAVSNVAKKLKLKDVAMQQQVQIFLGSPEIQMVARHLFSTSWIDDADSPSNEEVWSEFKLLLSKHLGVEIESIIDLSESIFSSLVNGVEAFLEAALDSASFRALDMRMSRRFKIVRDELASINQNLDMLNSNSCATTKEILRWEDSYRKEFGRRMSKVRPPFFSAEREVPIDHIYVTPRLIYNISRHSSAQNEDYTSFIDTHYRSVLLGDPGAGKSTFTQWICYELCKNYSKKPYGGRSVTPFLVVLRDYGAWIESQRSGTIIQHLEAQYAESYQRPVPKGAVEYILRSGRGIIIFDGLDELIDTRHRRKVADAIESFTSLYTSTPILVTSRIVGYDKAPLDKTIFNVIRLGQFSNSDVDSYAHKWFSLDEDMNHMQQKNTADAFVKESNVASDIRNNPLMLSLMCNIYKGEGDIPKNRPAVYEKCAEMLFERWDKRRGIRVELPIDHHIRPAIQYLAAWMYSDTKLQSGVDEVRVVSKTAEYLGAVKFADRAEAKAAATQFVSYCRGRAWVLSEAGLSSSGDSLYMFTHRTFMEYFTAQQIVSEHETSVSLMKVLRPRIEREEWDVVCQLAFQIKSRANPGAPDQPSAADQMLNELISVTGGASKNKENNCASFAIRSLEYLVPTESTSIAVVWKAVRSCIDTVANSNVSGSGLKVRRLSGNTWEQYTLPGRLITPCFMSTHENERTIRNALGDLFARGVKAISYDGVVAAYYTLNMLFNVPNDVDDGIHTSIVEIVTGVIEESRNDIRRHAKNNLAVGQRAMLWRVISPEELIEWHGIASIFQELEGIRDGQQVRIDPVSAAFMAPKYIGISTRKVHDELISKIGKSVAAQEPPYITKTRSRQHVWRQDTVPTIMAKGELAYEDASILYLMIVKTCIVIEAHIISKYTDQLLEYYGEDTIEEQLMKVRMRQLGNQDLLKILEAIGIRGEQYEEIKKWTARRFSYVKRS